MSDLRADLRHAIEAASWPASRFSTTSCNGLQQPALSKRNRMGLTYPKRHAPAHQLRSRHLPRDVLVEGLRKGARTRGFDRKLVLFGGMLA